MMLPTQLRSIYLFTISTLIGVIALPIYAQDIKQTPTSTKTTWIEGITVQVDAASIVNTTLFKGDTYSTEGGVQINLKNKFYPVVEIGLGGANKTSSENINFNTDALFGRIGVDFNLKKKKENAIPSKNLFFAGVRLGFTNFNYDISNSVINDEYWGGTRTIDYLDQNTTKVWFEIVGGVKVYISKNISMGWMVRNKNLLSSDSSGNPSPWYIPGFGENSGSKWGFNYTVGYRF